MQCAHFLCEHGGPPAPEPTHMPASLLHWPHPTWQASPTLDPGGQHEQEFVLTQSANQLDWVWMKWWASSRLRPSRWPAGRAKATPSRSSIVVTSRLMPQSLARKPGRAAAGLTQRVMTAAAYLIFLGGSLSVWLTRTHTVGTYLTGQATTSEATACAGYAARHGYTRSWQRERARATAVKLTAATRVTLRASECIAAQVCSAAPSCCTHATRVTLRAECIAAQVLS